MADVADVRKLIEQWSPVLREAFLKAVYGIRDRVVINDIVKALQAGDIEAAVRAVGLEPVAFRPLEAALAATFEGGGTATMASLPAVRGAPTPRLVVLFDVRNPEAESWLRNHSGTLIREVLADQVEMVREHLVQGMAEGQNPRTVALDLVGRINPQTKKREGGVIGLTSTHETWVKNYAAKLAANDPSALKYQLRDKRFDKTFLKAVAAGKPLSPEQRDKMVNAFRQRALKFRANALARTEAMTALNQSQMSGIEQGILKGKIKEQHVTKTWSTSGDDRVRHTHVGMDGQTVPFRKRYTSPSGARLSYPGDPTAPAAERVNCRCWQNLKVNFIAQAIEEGGL